MLGWFCAVLIVPPSNLLNLLLQLPILNIYTQTSAITTCLRVCPFARLLVIRELLFLTEKST